MDYEIRLENIAIQRGEPYLYKYRLRFNTTLSESLKNKIINDISFKCFNYPQSVSIIKSDDVYFSDRSFISGKIEGLDVITYLEENVLTNMIENHINQLVTN